MKEEIPTDEIEIQSNKSNDKDTTRNSSVDKSIDASNRRSSSISRRSVRRSIVRRREFSPAGENNADRIRFERLRRARGGKDRWNEVNHSWRIRRRNSLRRKRTDGVWTVDKRFGRDSFRSDNSKESRRNAVARRTSTRRVELRSTRSWRTSSAARQSDGENTSRWTNRRWTEANVANVVRSSNEFLRATSEDEERRRTTSFRRPNLSNNSVSTGRLKFVRFESNAETKRSRTDLCNWTRWRTDAWRWRGETDGEIRTVSNWKGSTRNPWARRLARGLSTARFSSRKRIFALGRSWTTTLDRDDRRRTVRVRGESFASGDERGSFLVRRHRRRSTEEFDRDDSEDADEIDERTDQTMIWQVKEKEMSTKTD